jgi:hypothetical protein
MVNKTGSKKGNGKGIKSTWAIGGTTLLGLGVGFILLPISALLFVASLMIGIGVGVLMMPFISRGRD